MQTAVISLFEDESRLFIKNDQMQPSIPDSHSKVENCGVQKLKQKGKLVFNKSGVFHIWHIVSSVVY